MAPDKSIAEFEGFDGFVNFAREVNISINSPVWKSVRQRLLKPQTVSSEKESVKELISKEPQAKEYKIIAVDSEFVCTNIDVAVENQISGEASR